MTAPVLIVDDSLTVRADLEDAFEEHQIATIACSTLAEARAVMAAREVGLMILDVMLPDGDGIDLLREVRATDAGATLPVLVLSSEAQVSHRIRGMLTGSNDYVGKPYDRDRLVARAMQLLELAGAPSDAAPLVQVIDDSLTYREQLGALLREQGYQVALAHTGEEGLRAMALRRPAVLVVDRVLPGIDGAGVVRRLRLDPALRTVPCILLTGADEEGAELHALEAGADAFVRKDGDAGMLLARLAAVLRNVDGGGKPMAPQAGQRILAVDDSRTYLFELAEVLGDEGYDMILAESGEQALALLKVQKVDCVLLDRLMPGLSGTDTCYRLKGDAATRDIPLIMLTAMEDRAAMIEGLSTGADDYVLKSSDFDVLKARVRAQLRRKQFEDESRRIRAELMGKELEAAEMRAARALAESRAALLTELEQKNHDLEQAVQALEEGQREVAIKNRELEQANRLKSEFLSNMSHELRTPLNAIIGFSDLMARGVTGELSPKQQTCIGHVLSSGRHLLGLINDILDLSKVEAGKMDLALEPVDANTVLRACLSIVQDSAARRGIGLEFLPCAPLGQVQVDLRKFRQMVYNLLSNAVKFSHDGGRVTLSLHRLRRAEVGYGDDGEWTSRLLPLPDGGEPDFLEVRVRDGGDGIAATDLAALFETFSQLDSSSSRQHEGSGLGLALVSRLAELHGGTVGVTSAPGLGAQFSVWLPLRLEPQAPPPAPASRRVLVIEDDEHAAELLQLHLESIGFAVSHARDAVTALAMARSDVPDLITLDLLLPDASGWAVLDEIKSNPRLESVPVVIVSILAEEMKACVLGAAQLLQKPVSHQNLRDAVYALGLGNDDALAPTVVIVDDAATCARLSGDLAALNYKVQCYADGASALAAMPALHPNLMIVGLVLADISGFEVIAALHHGAADVPILVLSDRSVSDDDKRRLSGQVLRIMEKDSFNRRQFLFEVGRALQQRAGEPRP
ncbi:MULTISPECIES: response regulator [unclassified Duganella]|uniref:response regulator n=1 Tax=unclassified Duganella TaxID=2636909 RepID=UPI000E354D34|nr:MULTISPECIES: response regulator [unclassified Duganella]RFP19550.1 response regulator [Duganella sp. BJB475]RFP36131.1 response regulator [Duganella sp. BJB476]